MLSPTRPSLFMAVACTAAVFPAASIHAQVFGSGPSDSSLFTNGVFNVPSDTPPNPLGNLQQLNVFDGGVVGSFFTPNAGSEVNIYGGSVGDDFEADAGSEVNIRGGTVGDSGAARPGSMVNISGGSVGEFFAVFAGSVVNISGGTVGVGFGNAPGSDVTLTGGEFRLNGNNFTGATITLAPSEAIQIFTGTFADGSPFIFFNDFLSDVSLNSAPLPTLNTTPTVVTSPIADVFKGLRSGQTLTLQAGGDLGDSFAVVDATLNIAGGVVGQRVETARSVVNITGGSVGDDFTAFAGSEVNITGGSVGRNFNAFPGSEVNISGGTVGNAFDAVFGSVVNISGGTVGTLFDALSGSEVNISGGTIGKFIGARSDSVVNISGGTIGDSFFAQSGSEVNLFGTGFTLDGEEVTSLTRGEAFTVTDRGVTLAGLLADGSPFEFELASVFVPSVKDVFEDGATVTITLVSGLSLLGDYNGDGFVSQADLDLVLLNWGESEIPAGWIATDQFDGVQVSQNELDGVLLNWGDGTPPAVAIPEPASLTILAATLAITRRRRSCLIR